MIITNEVIQLADEHVTVEAATKLLLEYPRRTPLEYDVPDVVDAPMSDETLLRRTRSLNSRLSNSEIEALLERSKSAPWKALNKHADLADAGSSSEIWDSADQIYLHFRDPQIPGVNFAKIHKFLHLKYPQLFPIVDRELRALYWTTQKNLEESTGLTGRDNWRRRTWLAVANDLRTNRSSGALGALRKNLSDLRAAQSNDHIARIAQLSDLRILDILCWQIRTGK